MQGHPDSWLEGIRLENVRLSVASDPQAPFERGGHALQIHRARDLTLKDVQVGWGDLRAGEWQSAIAVDEAKELFIDGFRGRTATPSAASPALSLSRVERAMIQHSRAEPGTGTFLGLAGR